MLVTGIPIRAGSGIVVSPWEKLLSSLRYCDMRSTGYPAHRHELTIPTATNPTSAPSFARRTAEEPAKTRAEGSACAAAEEMDPNSPYPPAGRTMENARENKMH